MRAALCVIGVLYPYIYPMNDPSHGVKMARTLDGGRLGGASGTTTPRLGLRHFGRGSVADQTPLSAGV